MKKLLITLWTLAPLGVAAYHFGPGQHHLLLDDISTQIDRGASAAKSGSWEESYAAYSEALQQLPGDETAAAQKLRLARAKSGMLASKLPSARADLEELLTELEGDPEADPALLTETRAALASAQYYMTWLLRLEGQPREDWEQEIEASRQNYRLLAERAPDEASKALQQENLEASIRLARMDLAELQGLPLPSQ